MLDAAVPRHRIAVADDRSASASAPRSRSSPRTCTSRSRPGRSRTPRRPPPAGCSTRPATAACGSRRVAGCRTCTATRGRSPHDPGHRKPAGGVRAAAAPRGRAARRLDPSTRTLRPLDGDPAAPVPGVGADRPGLSDPGTSRSTRAPSTSTPTRCSAPAPDRAGRSSGGRSCVLRRRAPRDDARQAHQALGDRARHRAAESDDPADRQLAVDRRLLEEPRMEAHGVREFRRDSLRGRFVRRALQAAVIDVILPAFAEQLLVGGLGGGVSRDLASRAHVYLQARTHYGIIDARALAPLQAIWRSVLGEPDLRGARRPLRQAPVDPRRRARTARRRRTRVPANRRRTRTATAHGRCRTRGRIR